MARKITTPVNDKEPERREQARDVEAVLALDDAVGEAGAGAGRAGGDLGDDGADQRKAAGDLQAGEEIGQGGRAAQIPERLQPREEAADEGRRAHRGRVAP